MIRDSPSKRLRQAAAVSTPSKVGLATLPEHYLVTGDLGHILEKLEARIVAGQERLEARIASGLERLEALIRSVQQELPAMEPHGVVEGAKIEPEVHPAETALMVSNHVKGKSWEESVRHLLESSALGAVDHGSTDHHSGDFLLTMPGPSGDPIRLMVECKNT
jgi:hypothetical protein